MCSKPMTITEDRPSSGMSGSDSVVVKIGETEDKVQILDVKKGEVREYPKVKAENASQCSRKLLME